MQDDPEEMAADEPEKKIHARGVNVRKGFVDRVVEGVGECFQERQGPEPPFDRGPENARDDLDGNHDRQEREIQKPGQLVVARVGRRQELALGVPGRGKMMMDFLPEGPEQTPPPEVRHDLPETADRGSPEKKVESPQKQEDEGVSQVNVDLLKKHRRLVGETQFFVPVEQEIAFEQQEDDEKIRPVPEAQADFPDRKVPDLADGRRGRTIHAGLLVKVRDKHIPLILSVRARDGEGEILRFGAEILEVDAQGDRDEKERIGISEGSQGLKDRGVIRFDLEHQEVQSDARLHVGGSAGAHENVLRVLSVHYNPSVGRQVDECPRISQKTHFHSQGHGKDIEGRLSRLTREIHHADFQTKAEVGGQPPVDFQGSSKAVFDLVLEEDSSGRRGKSQGIVEQGEGPDAEKGDADAGDGGVRLVRFGGTGVREKVPDRVPSRFKAVQGVAGISVGPGDGGPDRDRSQTEDNEPDDPGFS